MSEKTVQTDGELFDTDSSEMDPETGSNTDELDLDGEETKGNKNPARSDQREAQITTWVNRVKLDASVIDKIPAHMKWLRDEVESRTAPKEAKREAPQVDDAWLEAKLEERERNKEFTAKLKELNEALTADQKRAVEREYKALGAKGKDVNLLNAAIRLAGLSDLTLESRRTAGMKMPRPGMDSATADTDDIENMSEDELVAYSEKRRSRRFGPPRI